MDIRHSAHPSDVSHYSTQKLRDQFLAQNLFVDDDVRFVYSHDDRMVIGGAVPKFKKLELQPQDAFKTAFFLERRELGIVNIGGVGKVATDGDVHTLNPRECLYVGRGVQSVSLETEHAENPARFYLVSTPAHHTYETQKVTFSEAESQDLGSDAESNRRILYRFIHQGGIQSCQLMLGMTVLQPNNMWNTMPAHLHDRRMEAYLYFDLAKDARVFHLMGQPNETRHIVVQNEEAVISPSWSIHSGVGTSNYTFIWAMAGENYTFTDMDPVSMNSLR